MKQDNRPPTVLVVETNEQLVAYGIALAALGVWVLLQPPPEHWLPIVVLSLATIAAVISFVAFRRNRNRVNLSAPNPDSSSESN